MIKLIAKNGIGIPMIKFQLKTKKILNILKNLRDCINVSKSILIDDDIQKRVIEISEKLKLNLEERENYFCW